MNNIRLTQWPSPQVCSHVTYRRLFLLIFSSNMKDGLLVKISATDNGAIGMKGLIQTQNLEFMEEKFSICIVGSTSKPHSKIELPNIIITRERICRPEMC